MKNKKLVSRYASALYDFAAENNCVLTVYENILLLKKVFIENPELRRIIESPVCVNHKKREIFAAVFQNKIHNATFTFLQLIVTKRREPELMGIYDAFIHIYYEENNIKEATIISASPLSEDLEKLLVEVLEDRSKASFIIHKKVDPSIIGGLIIKIEDYLFDASILNKIAKLKREFSKNIYEVSY